MSRWSTITIDVDKDEVLRELDDEDLKAELERRNEPVPAEKIIDSKSLETDMKIKIIREHLHKFTWLEICDIFENKKH